LSLMNSSDALHGFSRICAAACLAAPFATAPGQQARAAENGLTEYPIGADSYGIAFRPPPAKWASGLG
jgi:hypothetical protein